MRNLSKYIMIFNENGKEVILPIESVSIESIISEIYTLIIEAVKNNETSFCFLNRNFNVTDFYQYDYENHTYIFHKPIIYNFIKWYNELVLKKKQKINLYDRKGIFQLDDVLPYVVTFDRLNRYKKGSDEYRRIEERSYNGEFVHMSSKRLQLFALKGVKCVRCGIEGKYFALERHMDVKFKGEIKYKKRYHLNLYAIDYITNEEVLMTKDHIIPQSLKETKKNGYLSSYFIESFDNLQPMCRTCNEKKDDKI